MLFVIRVLSLGLIVIALMLLGADVVNTLEMPGHLVVRSLDRILMLFGIDMTPWVPMNFPPWATNASLTVLASPAWVATGILGVILSILVPSRSHARYK